MASLTDPFLGTSMILVTLLGRLTSNMFPLCSWRMSRCWREGGRGRLCVSERDLDSER